MAKPQAKNKKNKRTRWVIKAGSNMVCSGGPLLIKSWAQQVAQLRREYNIEVIWVSSGAIASAKSRITTSKIPKKNLKLSEKQALSAIGQPLVMDLYNMALQAESLRGAQVLLTSDDLNHRGRRQNLKNTLQTLLKWDIVPILNENDTVATEEIQFGDNDSLSARVAIHMKADRLVILTDVDGLFDSDPTKNPQARLLPFLDRISPKALLQPGLKGKSQYGTGGMFSKLLASRLATQKGIDSYLVKGDVPAVLLQLAKGVSVGTHIKSKKQTQKN